MLSRMVTQMALRRMQERRYGTSAQWAEPTLPLIRYFLVVGAALYLGLVGLNAYLEPPASLPTAPATAALTSR